MEKTTNRIVGFDLIRLLACLFVCIVHFNASLSGYQNGVFLHDNSIVPNFVLRTIDEHILHFAQNAVSGTTPKPPL